MEFTPLGGMQQRRSSDAPHVGGDIEAARTAVAEALSVCREQLAVSLSQLREDSPRERAMDSLRSAIAEFARVTRRIDMPPERVIVVFKMMVRDLSPIQPWRVTERDELTGELVQMMIEAYYAGRGDGDGTPLDSRAD